MGTGIPAIIAAVLAGAFVFAAAKLLSAYLSRLMTEKRLRYRLEGMAAFGKKGLEGNLVFLAEKTGKLFLNSRFAKHVLELTADIARYSSILGEPYSRYSVNAYVGFQILCGAAAALVSALLFGPLNFFTSVPAAAAGLAAPFMALSEKFKERQRSITRQLPEFLDMLTLMLEAGLDIGTALNRVSETGDGALYREFASARREAALGRSRAEALEGLSEKLRHTQLSTFIKTLNTSLATGGTLLPAVRSLASQFKTEQVQEAEKQAGQAPLKLMLPLILFIFPTVFIILFGPILLAFLTGKLQ